MEREYTMTVMLVFILMEKSSLRDLSSLSEKWWVLFCLQLLVSSANTKQFLRQFFIIQYPSTWQLFAYLDFFLHTWFRYSCKVLLTWLYYQINSFIYQPILSCGWKTPSLSCASFVVGSVKNNNNNIPSQQNTHHNASYVIFSDGSIANDR